MTFHDSPTDIPDPEVVPKAKPKFSVEYKLRTLDESDNCTEPGQIGALLRREGLYASQCWEFRGAACTGRASRSDRPRRG
jgi:transposase